MYLLLSFYSCSLFSLCFFSKWHSSLQIDRHYSTFLVPDMSIEKLQKVATTHVDASIKARWLSWWNSPANVKSVNKFPPSLPLREKVLDDWLHRASFWAQVLQSNIVLFCFSLSFFVISNFMFVLFSWRRVLRLKSPPSKMNARLTLIGLPRRTSCNLLITSSIGG